MAYTMRVLVVADDPLARAGLATLLASQPACAVVGQAASDADLAGALQVYRPDVIVWDLGASAAQASADFRDMAAPVVALLPDANAAADAWAAGARGLLLRDASAESIAAAIVSVAQGLAVLDPALAASVLPAREQARRALVEALTPRELQVLRLMAEGQSNKEITMPVLTELSNALAAAVEYAGAGVARVEARHRLPASGIVWSSDGVIVTAHHVVEQDENIGIGLADGRTATAKLVGRDPTTDVAVLRAQTAGLTTRTWADLASLKVGHLVLALGRPEQTVMATLGIVSALGESWRTPAGGNLDRYLQTDVVMYPGFSGGPLIDAGGQFIGLNTSALLRGISITVPVTTLRQVVETLLSKGRISRGYLGVGAQPVRLPSALAQQLKQETGLLLVSVEPDGPADKAGLLLGDVIVALDKQPVRHLDDLLAALTSNRIGASAQVRIVRGGAMQEIRAIVGERA